MTWDGTAPCTGAVGWGNPDQLTGCRWCAHPAGDSLPIGNESGDLWIFCWFKMDGGTPSLAKYSLYITILLGCLLIHGSFVMGNLGLKWLQSIQFLRAAWIFSRCALFSCPVLFASFVLSRGIFFMSWDQRAVFFLTQLRISFWISGFTGRISKAPLSCSTGKKICLSYICCRKAIDSQGNIIASRQPG